jgi:hypothetical protein
VANKRHGGFYLHAENAGERRHLQFLCDRFTKQPPSAGPRGDASHLASMQELNLTDIGGKTVAF